MRSQQGARRHRGDDVHDRVEHREREFEDLRELVDEGESEWTPVILGGGILLLLIPIVALVIGIVFAFYYWAA